MIARVTLEIALRKEFDYLIPPELTDAIEVGSRVKVPFGPRQVLGCVTGLVEQSMPLECRHEQFEHRPSRSSGTIPPTA